MALLHVLRVFTGAGGIHGNALGVVLDGRSVADHERQGLAAELGFSETVFVDDARRGPRAHPHTRRRAAVRRAPAGGHRLAAAPREAAGRHAPAPGGRGDRVVRGRPRVRGQPARVVAGLRAGGLRLGRGGRGARGPARRGRSGDGLRARGRRSRCARGSSRARWGSPRTRPRGRPRCDWARGSAARSRSARASGSEIEVRPLDDGRVEVGGRAVLDEVRALTH